MISGDLAPLEAWLDARHGPGSFARMFRAPTFVARARAGQVMPHRWASPRSSGLVRPVMSSPGSCRGSPAGCGSPGALSARRTSSALDAVLALAPHSSRRGRCRSSTGRGARWWAGSRVRSGLRRLPPRPGPRHGFRGDPVEPDRGGGESAAVVTQDDGAVETGGDCGCLAGQLAHPVAVGRAGGGVGGGLDQQAAFGRQPGIGAAQPGLAAAVSAMEAPGRASRPCGPARPGSWPPRR